MEGWVISVGVGVVVSVITGFISGGLSSQRTIAALTVHIDYLRADIARHDAAITRAHERVDRLEKAA